MTTLIGIFIGLGLMMFSIILTNAPKRLYWDPHALMLVFGGTLAASLIAHPLNNVLRGLRAFFKVFIQGSNNFVPIIGEISEISRNFSKEGIPALEKVQQAAQHGMFRDGIGLIINGYNAQEIRATYDGNIKIRLEREKGDALVFRTMAKMAPAFGMIGTLVGLIHMLSVMGENSSALGSGMAIALVATFYGLIFANLIFGPIGEKLDIEAEDNYLLGAMYMDGLIMILEKRHPLYIKDRLAVYVPPRQRGRLFGQEKTQAKKG
ncbi:MAG: MotA/TolQ/ExbB proton channel family protein [Elusimicrobia bacterium]|nr:MotA/TolQ/ExbB proton channel family protein [Elusimicrobiota bacterium]